MARPRQPHPTPAELEVLQIVWDRGPSTVRDVLDVLNRTRRRAYTSVMTLMNVMVDKGQLSRRSQGRAHVYAARACRKATLGRMVDDLVDRAFEGSAGALVSRMLDRKDLTPGELDEIRRLIDERGAQEDEQ